MSKYGNTYTGFSGADMMFIQGHTITAYIAGISFDDEDGTGTVVFAEFKDEWMTSDDRMGTALIVFADEHGHMSSRTLSGIKIKPDFFKTEEVVPFTYRP